MNLAKKFLSKIKKDANDDGCWYLKSDDGSSFKDVFYFKRKGYKAKRFSYLTPITLKPHPTDSSKSRVC